MSKLKIYKISQNIVTGYDTYSDAVVCAENEEEARKIHPSKYVTHYKDGKWMGTYSMDAVSHKGEEYENDYGGDWPAFSQINEIKVEYIGIADKSIKKGMIVSSFHAG